MRASGVLLPVSSLSSKYGIGCFSKEAYQFVDFLKKNGQSYWQILPLGQTSYGDSPYQSFSTFAGNPYFISLEKLISKGLLRKKDCDACDFGSDPADIDYGKMYRVRYRLLKKAFQLFYDIKDAEFVEFLAFQEQEADWLSDYALFMALKDYFKGKSWVEWPDDIRLREPEAIKNYEETLKDQILFYKYVQYEFFSQWEELKSYANKLGVQMIGDIPIYVALDSADAWAQPELFQFDKDRRPVAVAGCPPDGFSATGQLWGNPLYDWEYHKKTGYAWWIRRVGACRRMYDVIRIDHFRGFDEYYSIPAKDQTAEFGKWEKGPGIELFHALNKALGELNIIVEDLGYITDSVRELVRAVGFPNMKVLEFAFDARDSSGPRDYLPYNYDKNCVVYTGTHDNETLRGWLDSIPKADYGMIERYLGHKVEDKDKMVAHVIRLAQASSANLCIVPMQDYLGLDNKARINEPSTLGKNWRWRLLPNQLTPQAGLLMKNLTKTYGRLPIVRTEAKAQPADKAAGEPAGRTTEKNVDKPSGRTAEKNVDKPSGRTFEKNVDEPSGRTTEKNMEESSGRTAEKNVNKNTEQNGGMAFDKANKHVQKDTAHAADKKTIFEDMEKAAAQAVGKDFGKAASAAGKVIGQAAGAALEMVSDKVADAAAEFMFRKAAGKDSRKDSEKKAERK